MTVVTTEAIKGISLGDTVVSGKQVVTGVSFTDKNVVTGVDGTFVYDAVKDVTLESSDSSSTGSLSYLNNVTISNTQFNTDAIKGVTLGNTSKVNDVSIDKYAYSEGTRGSKEEEGASIIVDTYDAVIKGGSLSGTATSSGSATVAKNGIKSASLSASTTSTDGPQYIHDVAISTTQFNTDAIKAVSIGAGSDLVTDITADGTSIISTAANVLTGVSLGSAASTASSGETYVQSVSLGGTTTFITSAIGSVTLNDDKVSVLNSWSASVDGQGVLSFSTGTTSVLSDQTTISTTNSSSTGTVTISPTSKKMQLTPTSVTLTGTKGGLTTTAASKAAPTLTTKTVKYMKLSTTAADTGTISFSGTSAVKTQKEYVLNASIDNVTVASTTAATKSAPSLTKTTKYMSISTVAAPTSNVSVSTSSIHYGSGVTTKYINTTAATTGSITPYTFTSVDVAKVGTAVTAATGKVVASDTSGDTVVTSAVAASAKTVALATEVVTNVSKDNTNGTIDYIESVTVGTQSTDTGAPKSPLA